MKHDTSAQGVSINNNKLHEISMTMAPYSIGTLSQLLYPQHRIKHEHQGEDLILMMPAFLALELYAARSQHLNIKPLGQHYSGFLSTKPIKDATLTTATLLR